MLALLIGCFVVMWSAHDDQDIVDAQRRTPITVTRVYTGPDGQSHAEDIEVKRTPISRPTGAEGSDTLRVTGLSFRRTPHGTVTDWHTAPGRQYVIGIRGRGEIEVAGGQKIPIEPGRVLRVEDVTGKGHISRYGTAGSDDFIHLVVQFGDQ
jgi:quercetin dioxygenase-like cupin family protein